MGHAKTRSALTTRHASKARLALPLALALFAAPALAQTPPEAQWRPASEIATHLAENGFRVMKLDREHDGYEADLIDRQGNRVEARVNPVTAELVSTKSEGRAGPVHEQWLTLAQVARHLEGKGFTVRKIETEASGYEADLTDRGGARTEAKIDPMSGEILASKPD
ncbi:PepSY domain-containing protein [Xanthobacter sediminis]|uniref:PepSY domain-containing protein n=1 Tax=Xanthobacter sediminis TaxID=3119926 RepID=UPI00372C133E